MLVNRCLVEMLCMLTRFVLVVLPRDVFSVLKRFIPLRLKQYLTKEVMRRNKRQGSTLIVKDGRKFCVIGEAHFIQVFYNGVYEERLTEISRLLIDDGDIAVDVGASFGWYSTLFAAQSPLGKVIAYEPHKNMCSILKMNVDVNCMGSIVDVRNKAVGERSGGVSFQSGASGESALGHVVLDGNVRCDTVESITLDADLSGYLNNVSYIKIDIEGSELNALKGAMKLLKSKNQPILQIEVNDAALELQGTSRSDLLLFLTDCGYSFYMVSSKSRGSILVAGDCDTATDLFCFGNGKYSSRISRVLGVGSRG